MLKEYGRSVHTAEISFIKANIAACTKQRHDGTISTAPIAEATFVGEVAKHESEVSGILSSASREISSTKRVTTAIDADEFLKSTAPLPPIARHKGSVFCVHVRPSNFSLPMFFFEI